jgi:hypothetical protein
MKLLRYIIVTAICAAIAYGIGDSFGKAYIEAQKTSGGLILARDLISYQYLGWSFAIIVILFAVWLFINDKGK